MQSLIQASTLNYRQMLSLLESVRILDLDQARAVMAAQEQFALLQAEAKEIDGRINVHLAQGEIPEALLPLLQVRHEVIGEVAEKNRLVAPRLTTMMALVQAELREICKGRQVVSGYAKGSRGTIRGFRAQG